MASFPNTLQKVAEARHFLALMWLAQETGDENAQPAGLVGRQAFKFALSAFLSAARAVPHLLQEEGADIPGFTRWYVSVREHGLNDRLMAFFSGRSEYRLVFEEAVEVVQLPPSQLTNHCVTPAEEAGGETSAARPPAAAAARAFFEGQPSYSVIELCGRHLEHLARLVDFAEAQLGGPAPRPRRPMGYAT